MQKRAFLVPVIIALNILVFVMWNGVAPEDFMAANFLVSWDALLEGRYWTLLTSAFSHNMLFHIFINMFVLNSFGSVLEQVMGWRVFLTFYLLASLVSSLSHAVLSLTLMGSPGLPALGASGAVAGLVLIFSVMFPREKILLLGIIPIPALIGALGFIGFDIWGLISQVQGHDSMIGHGAHLGGAFTGILFYFFFLRPRMQQSRARALDMHI